MTEAEEHQVEDILMTLADQVRKRRLMMYQYFKDYDRVSEERWRYFIQAHPDSKVHGANMGPTWVLSAPDRPHEPCYQGS